MNEYASRVICRAAWYHGPRNNEMVAQLFYLFVIVAVTWLHAVVNSMLQTLFHVGVFHVMLSALCCVLNLSHGRCAVKSFSVCSALAKMMWNHYIESLCRSIYIHTST